MFASGDESGNVGNVRQKECPDGFSDLPHPFEVNDSWISARADRDHIGFVLGCHRLELIVVDPLVVFADAVVNNIEEAAMKLA